MIKYKVVPFQSDHRGLDRLVKQCQYIPSQRIGAAIRTTGAPQQGALDSCLKFIERIDAINVESPGGHAVPDALEVCWGTYAWLQDWVMSNPIVGKDPGPFSEVSYNAYLERLVE